MSDNLMFDNLEFISAGAGSGKTFTLTEKLYDLLIKGEIKPANVIATTFTVKAATELRERVRQKLLEKGESQLASSMGESLISTINSVCGQLLADYSYEAGLSPELSVIDENEGKQLFNQALEANISPSVIRDMNRLAYRLAIENWKSSIISIAEAARANNISPRLLKKMGKNSADDYLKYFPKTTTRALESELSQAIIQALNTIDGEQKGTLKYIDLLNKSKRQLDNNNLQWKDWVSLKNASPTKAYIIDAEPVKDIARQYEKHPKFQQEINDFIQKTFNIAANSVAEFQQLKAENGFIDFVDQEQLLLQLLEKDDVRESLSEQLDLLMVDEFQDTSPIQLALFLKLAQCAKKVIFVGDIKQSIYGFRGSDPSLMNSVIDALEANGKKITILPNSYRSCKGLVEYTNEVFQTAFANSLKKAQVVLQPTRSNIPKETIIDRWQLKEPNADKRAHALAGAIKDLIKSKPQVVDKETEQRRDINLSDIAIFTRSNDNVDVIASALTQHGIAVQKTQSKLVSSPEAVLLIACIRRLIDPKDSLASAEIISLSECSEPELWLQDRLDFLDEIQKNKHKQIKQSEWAEDSNPLLAWLKNFREESQLYSPIEIIQSLMTDLHLRSTINQWGPDAPRSQQRLNNLESLIALAQDYENNCFSQGVAATLSGLLLWFYQLNNEGNDNQARVFNQDAVNVLTYHKAKGLEWPVVILTKLNNKPRTKIWNIRVSSELNLSSGQSGIDLSDPLKNRKIDYWPFPFGTMSKGIDLISKVEESRIGEQSLLDAIEEEKRLLYVAITRTRDKLICCLDKDEGIKAGGWLSLTACDWLLPEGKSLDLPNNSKLKTAYTEYQQIDPVVQKVNYKPRWFADYPTLTEKLDANISPSSASPVDNIIAGQLISIGERMDIIGSPNMASIGNAVHAIIAAKCINSNYSIDDADKLIRAMGMDKHIDASDCLLAAENLINTIQQNYPEATLYAEYPVQQVLDNGQIVKGWIDLLIETNKGWIICDHKSSPKKKSQLLEVAQSYSGQLQMYKDAIEASSNKIVLETWVHFAVSGVIIEA